MIAVRVLVVLVLVVGLVGCGSENDHTTTIGSLNIVGRYDGFDVHEFALPGLRCVLVDQTNDNNIGLSCVATTPTTTTPTTLAGGIP